MPALVNSQPEPVRPESGTRRVFTREEAFALADRLLKEHPQLLIGIVHCSHAISKVSAGAVLDTEDGDTIDVRWWSAIGSGIGVGVSTNQIHDPGLANVFSHVTAIESPRKPLVVPPLDPDDEDHLTFRRRDLLPVSLWHETTLQAMDSVRGDVLSKLVKDLKASGLVGSATLGFAARSALYFSKYGRQAYCHETDSELTVTARTPDNKASGWSGQTNRDWSQIRPDVVVAKAVDMANRSRNIVALEPGRRMAILGPAAVADLVRQMAGGFDAAYTDMGATPFSLFNDPRKRTSMLGMRVFDARIMMVSDPADPDGGFPSFFNGGDEGGYPTPAVTWIDHGVLKNLAYSVSYGMVRGKTPCVGPDSVRVMAAPGVQTATIEEMIANCREGVYVNRLSHLELLDQKSGMVTGVTRDGCFFIKNGKIDKPIKNFRIHESPFFSFNKLEMIGTTERVAFGYNVPPGMREWMRWPPLPVLAPPMMVQDFNFSALSDAV